MLACSVVKGGFNQLSGIGATAKKFVTYVRPRTSKGITASLLEVGSTPGVLVPTSAPTLELNLKQRALYL